MSHIQLKKLTLPFYLCVIFVLSTSVVLAAETGPIAAGKAADQKAALAKKAAEREAKKAAAAIEAKKAAEAQIPTETQKSVEENKEK